MDRIFSSTYRLPDHVSMVFAALAIGAPWASETLYAGTSEMELAGEQSDCVFHVAPLIGVVALIVAIGVLVCQHILLRRTMTIRARIAERFPLRYVVFDGKGVILLHSPNDVPNEVSNGASNEASNGAGAAANCVGGHLADFVTADLAELMTRCAAEVRATGSSKMVSFSCARQGRTATVSQLPRDLFGREAFLWVSQDTDELQKSRKESRRLAEHLHLTLQSIGDAVIVADAEGRITLMNTAAEEITGWSRDEVIGRDVAQVFRTVPEALYADANLIQDRQSFEFLLIDRNGDYIGISTVSTPILEPDGSSWGEITVFRNLSGEFENRKRLRESLRTVEESSEWFRLTINAIDEGVITTDCQGRIVMMNSQAEQMCGVAFADVKNREHESVFQLLGVRDGIPQPSPLTYCMQSGRIFDLADSGILVSADGHKYPVSTSAAPMHDRSGTMLGGLLMFRDITAEHAAREKLRVALTGLEFAAKLSRIAYFKLTARDFTIMECSSLFSDLWPVADGKAVSPDVCLLAEDREEFWSRLKTLARGTETSQSWQSRLRIDGTIRYVRVMLSIDNSDPGESYYLGVIQDVSALTRQEYEAENTSKLMRLILDNVPMLIYAKDADNAFRTTLANRAIDEFFGVPQGGLLGRNSAELISDPDVARALREMDEKTVRDMTSSDYTESVADARGVVHHFRTTKVPFVAADGHKMLVGVSVDLTREHERQQTMEKLQKELRDLLAQYKTLVNASETASRITNSAAFHFDLRTRKAEGTELLQSLWPFREGKAVSESEFVLPEDRKKFTDAIDRVVRDKTRPFEVEFRSGYFGEMRRYRILAEYSRDSEKPDSLIGMIVDITESPESKDQGESKEQGESGGPA